MQSVAVEATTAAEERAASLTDDLQTLAESSQQLESQNEQLAVELTTVRDELDALIAGSAQAVTDAAHKLDAAQAKIAELTKDLHDERQRSAGAQIELGKLQAKVDTVPGLEAQIAKLQGELKDAIAARAAAEQRAAVADAQTKLVNEQVAKATADAEKADQAHKEAIAQVRQDLTDSRQATRDSIAELTSARAKIDALRDAAAVKTAVGEPTQAPAPQ